MDFLEKDISDITSLLNDGFDNFLSGLEIGLDPINAYKTYSYIRDNKEINPEVTGLGGRGIILLSALHHKDESFGKQTNEYFYAFTTIGLFIGLGINIKTYGIIAAIACIEPLRYKKRMPNEFYPKDKNTTSS